ncbi:CDP-diacylglycerol--serine O-phosphatidyltransferase [candidate division TM6 bacterium RIFCSPHIGHO2_12_FULL_32_22]|nr:MAG: CDP-diacylglycerol--serine O-phosphatidyltransferase [candidate division TM6 bacterium RIFCSPHIGHO2_12_FULL_32_22]
MNVTRKISNFVTHKSRNSLKVVPFFFTFANALLGMFALMKALDDQFIVAVYCILLAAFMDGLDGRIARLFGVTSCIGGELDSLCDAISFCLAPAILIYSWGVQDFGIVGLAVVGLYLCAGLFRLARFNVFHKENESFMGLPTPMAAFFLLSFVLYRDWFEAHSAYFIFNKNFFSLVILFVAFLMVSTIKFPSFKYKESKVAKLWLISIFLFTGICVIEKYPVMFLLPLLYIFSGLFYQSYLQFKKLLIHCD